MLLMQGLGVGEIVVLGCIVLLRSVICWVIESRIVIQGLLSQQRVFNVVFNWSIVVFGWIWITVWVLLSQRIVFDTVFDWI